MIHQHFAGYIRQYIDQYLKQYIGWLTLFQWTAILAVHVGCLIWYYIGRYVGRMIADISITFWLKVDGAILICRCYISNALVDVH